jgi:molybdate transport system regulatory protein
MNEEYDCIVRIRVYRQGENMDTVFGRGTASLLNGVEKFHSLNRAAKDMSMSYSKAWKSINETEKHLGFELIDRRGQHGSELTERGRLFLNAYEEAERRAYAAAEEVFRAAGL